MNYHWKWIKGLFWGLGLILCTGTAWSGEVVGTATGEEKTEGGKVEMIPVAWATVVIGKGITISEDPAGDPVTLVESADSLYVHGKILARTQTDKGGNYKLTDLAPGDYNIIFTNRIGKALSETVTIPETGSVRKDVTMKRHLEKYMW